MNDILDFIISLDSASFSCGFACCLIFEFFNSLTNYFLSAAFEKRRYYRELAKNLKNDVCKEESKNG